MPETENGRRVSWKSIAVFVGVEGLVVLAVMFAGMLGTHREQDVAWGGLIFAMIIGFLITAPLTMAMILGRLQRPARAMTGFLVGAIGFLWATIVGVTATSDWSIH